MPSDVIMWSGVRACPRVTRNTHTQAYKCTFRRTAFFTTDTCCLHEIGAWCGGHETWSVTL